MLEMELAYEDGRSYQKAFTLPLLIGRAPECSLPVRSWRVARQHARILERGGVLFLEDLGSLGGTFINGRRVAEHGPLSVGDEIIIGPCRLRLIRVPAAVRPVSADTGLQRMAQAEIGDAQPAQPDAIVCADGRPPHSDSALTSELSSARGHIEAGFGSQLPAPACDLVPPPQELLHGPFQQETQASEYLRHRRRLHKALLNALDLRRRDILALSDEALRREATEVLSGILAQDADLPSEIERTGILQQVVDEAVGLGPLEPLLADTSVSEIMVNTHEEIYVERGGRLLRHQSGFSSEQAVVAIIDRIVAPLGRRVDEGSPMVDARLRDGSRVNAVIPPIALRGPCLTIRKFPQRRLEMQDLLAAGSLDTYMAEFLSFSVAARKSVVVSGGTGSGKTTLLNVLSNCIPAGERVITIEDAAELRLNHAHLISLESRPPNTEGKGRVEIRDLVRNALRMRPDRIIVGECRGAEAFDMLSAMNTGHEGSLTTLHANSPRDALLRLETMVLMAGMDLPLAAIREHISSAVDLIVQQARLSDGRRLVTAIVEVTGMEAGRIQTQELFLYRQDIEPRFEGCGVQPECFHGAEQQVPLEWLNQRTPLHAREDGGQWSC